MKRFSVTAGTLLCTAMMMQAHASDGRIAISGAVLTPTCGPTVVGTPHADTRAHCPGTAPTRYTLHLEPANSSNLRLVEYYDNYVHARDAKLSVWVATQAYD